MTAPLDLESAGREFDKWLDWNGAANASNGNSFDQSTTGQPDNSIHLPISPSSTVNGDGRITQIKTDFLTAPPTQDLLLTPRHSSGSPASHSSMELRLSGDTLRDEPTPSQRPMLKRKLSPTDVPMTDYRPDAPTPAAKKRPHNIIEKRYRANLNDKIAELRDSVPSLRLAQKSKVREAAGDSDEEDLDGLTPSNKLNKASILTKAVEYIRHLEFRTKRLEEENKSLTERLETLDKVIAQGGHDAQRATAFTSDVVIEESSSSSVAQSPSSDSKTTTANPPQGLIPLSDSWRNLRPNQPQEHYGHIYQTPAERSRFKGKWPTRIMLGSIAALMVMDGLNESDMGTESREKGLFGIPLEILDGWSFLRSPRIYLATFSQYCRAGGVIPLVKGFVALTFLAFLIFSYLFNSKPPPKSDMEKSATNSSQAPVPASPIEVRRRAWSTSMQELHLPHHNFFPEWIAITSEWLKYTFGYLFGPTAYSWLTGRTADDDVARIKAWDIAIDSQLAGGDAEVSRSRLLLTIFGAGNLPRTPLRLMLKALHCRVLLWNVGALGSGLSSVANRVGKFFANRQWSRAKASQDELPLHHADRLPRHLSEMLDMQCDEVFEDTVCQRAYNLMYDRPTREDSISPLLDVVVEDHAVRSPLDAVAAWRSSLSLDQALQLSLHTPEASEFIQEHLTAALKVAPPGSAAETRALAASSALGTTGRSSCLQRALDAMELFPVSNSPSGTEVRPPFIIDSSTPLSARTDILNCLHCAKTLRIMDQENDGNKARDFFVSKKLESENTHLLTQAALKHLLWRLPLIERPAAAAGEEVGIAPPHDHVSSADVLVMTNSKSKTLRRYSTVSNDSGYDSQDASMSAWAIDLESSNEMDVALRQEFMV
ncbi:Clr6 histone deacetylase associated PHD protein-2 Cph2 [Cladophialophora chaetospira]|uniref:Clr6 histone deacetylase associated PHD protein-2 Cph2 n=1 Tax=Cladophialophora chaetospira TaxID=386627 RepID=A0AA38X7M0_9EURO|nr:Clr6 histone deacetylase associated PHD protein-2 Cph2 [Cladophialophora chaetospira]